MTADMFSYVPGQHTAVIVWPVAVLINLPISDGRVGQLFGVLTEEASLETALDTLAAHGLTRMPDFALMAVGESDVHLTVHGSAGVLLSNSGQVVTSAGLLTDTTVPSDAVPILFMAGDETTTETDLEPRPILYGIVDVTHVMIGWTPPDVKPDQRVSPIVNRVGRTGLPKLVPQVDEPPSEPPEDTPPEDTPPDDEPPEVLVPDAPQPDASEQVEPVPAEPSTDSKETPQEEPPEPTGFEHLFDATTHIDQVASPPVVQPEKPAPAPSPSLGETQVAPSTMSLDAADAQPSLPKNVEKASLPDPDKPFITSFNWMGADKPATPNEPPMLAPPPPPPPEDVPPPPPPPPPPPADDYLSGHTIKRSLANPTGEMIAAVYCPTAHPNPPYAERCRICQAPIAPQQPVEVPRPSLGTIRLSNNLVLTLDRGAVLGRNPRPVQGSIGPQPNLVRLNDPNKDISSQHLEVRLEGWFVTVRDLNSTNGTQVFLPGQPPVTLRANEPMTLEPGARVVLAQVFDFVFEAQ